MSWFRNKEVLLVATALFILIFPLSNSIEFIQNDEHTRYLLIQNFLEGNFVLDPYISTTFYTQGFLGSVFAVLFGIKKLPLLTLLLAVTTFYIFTKVVELKGKSKVVAALVGLVLFFNPLFIYSTLGFMTEIYFLVFLVASFYYMEKYFKGGRTKDLLLTNLFILISYLARQVGLIISLAFLISLLFKKKWKQFSLQALFSALLLSFHLWIFPQTEQMKVTQLSFEPLRDAIYTSSIIVVVLIYLAAFFLPVFFGILANKKMIKNKLFLALLALFGILTFWFVKNHFDPLHIVFKYYNREGNLVYFNSSGTFPYFKNTFGREGFFVEDLQGTKYNFRGFFDLFRYWNLVAILTVPIIFVVVLNKKKYFANVYLIFIVLYGGALLTYPKIYDRYLLYMFPALLLFLVQYLSESKRFLYAIFVPFITFLIFLNYQYAQDFVFTQNYVWQRSEKLVEDEVAKPNEIKSGNSWQALYPREDNNWVYYFAYDTKGRCCFEIIEEKEIEFPGSLFIEPKVRLYKRVAE